MSEHPPPWGLIAFFPAAGAGGATQEHLAKLAARRGMAFLAMPNPASIHALESGRWAQERLTEVLLAVGQASPDLVILAGHCLGGLSAVHLASSLATRLEAPVRLLLVNTPCPDSAGRVPTMSQLPDAEIAAFLAHDGFPQDLLDDKDMLAEIAQSLRQQTKVGDRLAEWISSAGDVEFLYVLSTRGDAFSPPEQCAGWRRRTSREFQMMIAEGSHSIDEETAATLERALESVIVSARVVTP